MELAGINKHTLQAKNSMTGFSKQLGAMWRISGGIVLFNIIRAITHAFKDLVHVAVDFETQMRNVNSVAQMSEKDFASLNKEVINLALDPRIKDGPAQLAEGLYLITSSGYSAKDALLILKQAAMAATAGMSTTAVASDVLISTLGAYNLTAADAEKVTNKLFQIVNISKYTFDQLASSLASVTPTAAAMGIGIDEVGAAMATFGARGVAAETATVQMNAILSGLLKPTTDMTEQLHALGFASGEAMIEQLGFTKTMQVFAQILDGDSTKAAALFGDVRALRGIMTLTNDGAVALTKNLEMMGFAQDGAGATAKALNEQMKASSFQMAIFRKHIQILAVLGFGLIAPYLSKALLAINSFVSKSIVNFRIFRDQGYGFFDSLRKGIGRTVYHMFGPEVAKKVRRFMLAFEDGFNQVKAAVLIAWPFVVRFLTFVVDHIRIIGPAFLGAVVGLKAFMTSLKVLNIIIALTETSLLPVIGILLLVAAVGALVAIAWMKNWGGIREKTASVVDFLGKALSQLWEWFQPVIDTVAELGMYFKNVATGDIQPFGDALKKLPGWLQPIAYVLARVIKTARVFFKTWSDHGFINALKVIPVQLRAFGRALSGLFKAIGLDKFAVGVKATFYSLSKMIQGIIDFVDDVVHGRWKEAWQDLGTILIQQWWTAVNALRTGIALIWDLFNKVPWGDIFMGMWNGYKRALDWFGGIALPWIVDTGIDIIQGLFEALGEKWDESIGPWFAGFGAAAALILDESWKVLYDAGRDIVSWIWTGISSLGGWFWEQIKAIPGYAIDAVSWYANGFYNAGRDIVSGLWTGISSLGGWLYDQVKSFAYDNTIGAFNEAIGRKSPPKAFIEAGQDISKAVSLGVDKMAHMARNSSMRMMGMTSASPSVSRGIPRGSRPVAIGATANRTASTRENRRPITINQTIHSNDGKRIARELLSYIQLVEQGQM